MSLVSVVVPAYNAEAYVEIAVRSALRQTYATIEIAVVDDGSEDQTSNLLKTIRDDRMRVIYQTNSGVACARNRGIQMARGLFIAFLDADDTWAPEKLARQLAAMTANPDWVAVGSHMNYISPAGRTLGIAGQPVADHENTEVRAARLMPFPLSSLLVKREALDRVGFFEPDLATLGQVEDLDFLSRIARHGRIGCINEVLGGYRMHGGSASARHFRMQRRGARFLAARQAARDRGQVLYFAEFMSSQRWWNRLDALRKDFGAYSFRSAGIAVANGRLSHAAVWAFPAIILTPLRTVRRLSRQRGQHFLLS